MTQKVHVLKYKIVNIEPDKATHRPNHCIVSIEFQDDSGDQPYILAFSIENPKTPMSVERLLEIIKEKHSILRPDRFFFPIKEAVKNKENFTTTVDETKVKVSDGE